MASDNKKENKSEAKKTVHRDSDTGRFVTSEFAKKNKATTERERVRSGSNKSKGK